MPNKSLTVKMCQIMSDGKGKPSVRVEIRALHRTGEFKDGDLNCSACRRQKAQNRLEFLANSSARRHSHILVRVCPPIPNSRRRAIPPPGEPAALAGILPQRCPCAF